MKKYEKKTIFQNSFLTSSGGWKLMEKYLKKVLGNSMLVPTGVGHESGQITTTSPRHGQKRTKVEKRVVFPYKNPYSQNVS